MLLSMEILPQGLIVLRTDMIICVSTIMYISCYVDLVRIITVQMLTLT